MTDRVPMTKEGAEKLRVELDKLKRMRPVISGMIKEAREHGDLSENAEYHAAKEQQGLAEAKVRDIEAKLSLSHIIDVTQMTNDGKVIFGATVKLMNIDTNEEKRYQIVGENEADLEHGRISYLSPVVRAIIGKFEGDEVEVKTPDGIVIYEVIGVEYI